MMSEFVSERLIPLGGFEVTRMAQGQPGVPSGFRWRKQDFTITEVLTSGKDYGDCRHGSGERYVRRHRYRVTTAEGRIFEISFQRSFGRSTPTRNRWWIHGVENLPES